MYYDGLFISAADLGNINYGYAGLAAGFTPQEILLMGGFIHQVTAPLRDEPPTLENWKTFFDDPDDSEMIVYGMIKYLFGR